jgi:kynurenine formamidase
MNGHLGSTISEEDLLSYFESLSNWGRWGEDDQLGTLNFVGQNEVMLASQLVKRGKSISCARSLSPARVTEPGTEFLHKMQSSGESAPEHGAGQGTDWFAIGFHGYEYTHIDSFAHLFWDGKMYNNKDASLCTTSRGALFGGLEATFDGIVGRGILVDAPLLRGKEWLEPGEAIYPADLDAWIEQQGLVTKSGDFLWVRTGRCAWESAGQSFDLRALGTPGLHPSCLPWLHEHEIAVLVSDVANDVTPSRFKIRVPIHTVGIVAMGLWLVDNADMEQLSATAQTEGRYEFFSLIAPLTLRRATGSPINPIVIF